MQAISPRTPAAAATKAPTWVKMSAFSSVVIGQGENRGKSRNESPEGPRWGGKALWGSPSDSPLFQILSALPFSAGLFADIFVGVLLSVFL